MSPNYRKGLKLCDEFKISEELGIEYEDVVYTKRYHRYVGSSKNF